MVLSIYLYEDKSHFDVEISDEHNIVKVLHLSNVEAIILTGWLHNKDNSNIDDANYVRITGEEIYDIIRVLYNVINIKDTDKKDLLALFYFPLFFKTLGVSYNPLIFSEEYYLGLDNLYSSLMKIIPVKSVKLATNNLIANVDDLERVFFYNIKWE